MKYFFRIINIIAIFLLLVLTAWLCYLIFLQYGKQIFLPSNTNQASTIKNFKDCALAGNPIMESYPRQCRTADGQNFVEIIQPPEIITNTSSTLFESSSYNFRLWYPQGSVTKTENFEGYLPLAKIQVIGIFLPENLFTNTNLGEAAVLVGLATSSEAILACDKPVGVQEQNLGTKTINGQIFSIFSTTEPAAGNIYESKIYRTVYNDNCFEIVELLHSGNIANYPPGDVLEFNHNYFSGVLENIVNTFQFNQ